VQKDLTRVKVDLKFVKNLGNYESIHIDIGVDDFVRDIDANTDAAVDRIYEFVSSKLVEKVQEIEKDLGKWQKNQ
jgi:hypothetical protein